MKPLLPRITVGLSKSLVSYPLAKLEMLPDFFVMRDDVIKKGFRSVGVIKANRQQSRDFDGECYVFEFLPEMQARAFAFLDSYTHDNGGDRLLATRESSRAMDEYSLAKVIDELN